MLIKDISKDRKRKEELIYGREEGLNQSWGIITFNVWIRKIILQKRLRITIRKVVGTPWRVLDNGTSGRMKVGGSKAKCAQSANVEKGG